MAVLLICEDRTQAAQADALARLALEDAAQRDASWAAGMFADPRMGLLVWDGTTVVEPDQPDSPCFVQESHAKASAERRGTARPIRAWGASPDARTWRAALIAAMWDMEERAQDQGDAVDLQAVVILSDSDGDDATDAPVYKAASAFSETAGVPVIVGRPHQDAEAWFMAGLCDQLRDDETRRCQETQDSSTPLGRRLGFDPRQEPHRLTHSPNGAHTDAKRVMRYILYNNSRSRTVPTADLYGLTRRCFDDVARLQRLGRQTGLTDFLNAIQERLYPALTNAPPNT